MASTERQEGKLEATSAEEKPSMGAAQAWVRSTYPEKHTDRGNQQMKPPVRQIFMSSHQERVLHQRLLCNNFGQNRKASKHFTTTAGKES